MRIHHFIAILPILSAANELEELYGIEDSPSKFAPTIIAGASLERNPFDSLVSTLYTGAQWVFESNTSSLSIQPTIAGIQVGTDDPFRVAEVSLALSAHWKVLQMGLTPWYAQAPTEEYESYGVQGFLGLGGSPWKDSWLEGGVYFDWADSSTTTTGLYASLGHRFFFKSLWHGPLAQIDIPFQSEEQSMSRRGGKSSLLSTRDALGLVSYQVGFAPLQSFWSIESEAGLAATALGEWDTWGSLSVSLSW